MSIPAEPAVGSQILMPLARLQQLDDKPYHRTGRVELAALLARVVGEPVYQVLIRIPQHVVRAAVRIAQVVVAQVKRAEVV